MFNSPSCTPSRLLLSAVGLLSLVALPGFSSALYSSSDDVELLDSKSFSQVLGGSDGRKGSASLSRPYLVEFYAPWCGHCKNLAPEWKKAARALKGIVGVAAVDAADQANAGLAQKYGVQGFPTIKLFFPGEERPKDYQGPRQAEGIVDYALSEIRTFAQKRIGGAKGGSGQGGASGASADVVELDEAMFDEQVLKGSDPWIVEFYAPWCGHCKNLAPEFARAAAKMKEDGVKFGAVDATAHASLAGRFGVRGYPTLKVFRPEAISDSQAESYDGGRTASDLVAFAQILAEESLGPVEIPQLLSSSTFEETCQESKVCIVGFLPDIYDSGKDGRNQYLETFTRVAGKNRRLFNYVWSEGGAQQDLEQQLGLTFGFPAVAAIHRGKSASAVMTGAFTEEKIGQFLIGLGTGAARIRTLSSGGVAKIKTTDAWDGEDAPEEDEEFSLEDIMGGDF